MKLLVEENSKLSLNALNRLTGIEKTSIYRILTKNLKYKSVCSKWVPHVLTELNKLNRMEKCQDMLVEYSKRGAKVRQAPYSPDTKLIDRYFFRNYEVYRQSTDFTTHAEIKENVQSFLDTSFTTEKLGKEFKETFPRSY